MLPRGPLEQENIKPHIGDATRINIFQRYSYEHKSHFLNTINQYQGMQKAPPEPQLVETVRAELKKYKLVNETADGDNYSRVEKKHIKFILKGLNSVKK